jgi:hypothetical protein
MGCKATTNNKHHAVAANEKPSKDSVRVSFRYNGIEQGTENRNLDDKLLEVIQEKLKGKVNFTENGKFSLGQIEKELLESKDTSIRSLINPDDKQSGHSAVLKEEDGKVVIQITLHGLQQLAANIEAAYNKTNIIAKPLADTENKIVIYDSKTKKSSFEQLVSADGARIYSDSSAYCNGENHLYVSGGQKNKEKSDSFYDVDLVTKKVFSPKTKLSQPRDFHSMIYIPNNYVFIVGGRGVLKVEYYSLAKKEILPHSDLNEERIEPSLVVVNNTYLYAFTKFNFLEGKVDTFERINLRSNEKKWEYITPKPDIDITEQLKTHYYIATSYHSAGQIIFVGGDGVEENEKCYLYDYQNNLIKLSDVPNQQFEFGERFLLPLQAGNNYMIPNFESEDFKLVRYVANEGIKVGTDA